MRTRARSAALVVLLLALAAPLHAQYFGRNKVQYRAFDFEVIETEHFDVYFYAEERAAALDAARMAERAYARLSRVLQHEFSERKPIVLYASHSDFQQTNTLYGFIDESTGGVTESLKRRIIMPFTGSYAEFEHVFTHEMVHAFQYDVIFRNPLRDVTPVGFRPHLWFMEGMAEYLSIGRVDANTEAWLRDAVLTGYIRSIDEMSRRDDYLSYRFGQSLWTYIGSKWGDEVVGVLLQRAPRMGIDGAFETALGLTLDELSEEWLESLRATYLPQVADRQRPQLFAERLTDHEEPGDDWYIAPAISPDGDRLTYVSQRDGFHLDLWLADGRTGEPIERLVETSRDGRLESLRYASSTAAFSPDGRRVAFAALEGGRDVLYVLDLEKRDDRLRLTFELNGISNPSWSPDGTHIVFTGLDGGLSDLFVTDLQGRVERLTHDRYADLMPSWSPDGRTIAFTTDRAGTDLERLSFGNHRVALYDLESGDIEVLPHQDAGRNLNPVWSPDARTLVWVGDRTGTYELYLFDLETRELARITSLLSGVLSATAMTPSLSWAQRSGRLVFVYFESAGYNLYAIEDPRALRRHRVDPVVSPALVAAGIDSVPSHGPLGVPLGVARAGQQALLRDEAAPLHSLYRAAEGYRASDALPASSADERGPISLVALLDSAELALPDTASFTIEDYRPRFSIDAVGRPTVGVGVGGYDGGGMYGGSYLVLSDLLGNHNVVAAANLNGSLSDASLLFGYSLLKYRPNLGIAYQQYPLYRYLGQARFPLAQDSWVLANVWTRDVVRLMNAQVGYPFSTFRRVELGLTGYLVTRDTLFRGLSMPRGNSFEFTEDGRTVAYLEPSVALVFDNTLFGWTGPVLGTRYRVQVGRLLGENQYTELLADVRTYANWRRSIVLATRAFVLSRRGADADRAAWYWGSPYFLRGYSPASYDPNGAECAPVDADVDDRASLCPRRDQLFGSSFAMASAELRFPIITELALGGAGSLPPVDAVVFGEGGLAWEEAFCFTGICSGDGRARVHRVLDRDDGQSPLLFREPLWSVGAGLRLNLFYAVLRLDYAIALSRDGRPGFFLFALGPSF